MTSSRPTTVVSIDSSARTRLLRLSSMTTGPSVALPASSCSSTSQTVLQLPMSDQPRSAGTTAASLVRSITA